MAGCVSYEDQRNKLIESLDESERSYLVGKYSVQCKANSSGTKCGQPFNSMSVYYTATGELEYSDRFSSVMGNMFGADTSYDIVDSKKEEKGYYFCRILPAGEYSLFTIRYWNFGGGGSGYYLDEKDQFDIPFSLVAKKITVLDHVKLTTDMDKNIFGLDLAVPGNVELSSLTENEIQLALEKCPEAARGYELLNQNIWKKHYDSSFVRSKN